MPYAVCLKIATHNIRDKTRAVISVKGRHLVFIHKMALFPDVLKRYLYYIRKAKSCLIEPYIIAQNLTRMIILNWNKLVIVPAYDEDIGGIRMPELIWFSRLMLPFLGGGQFWKRPWCYKCYLVRSCRR